MSEPEKLQKKEAETKKSTGPGYLEVIIIALIMAAGVVAGYDKMFAQKIKVIDLKGYIRTQKALLVAGEINKNQLRINLDKIDQAVKKAADTPNTIILLKEVVLKNGDEISIK
ncbi:MAG TPA: hypothetical protein ENJ30_08485 [Desulfobulbaceae bacterium]|nr:hypothetical protein [Desulfobulbaceae bacterium]